MSCCRIPNLPSASRRGMPLARESVVGMRKVHLKGDSIHKPGPQRMEVDRSQWSEVFERRCNSLRFRIIKKPLQARAKLGYGRLPQATKAQAEKPAKLPVPQREKPSGKFQRPLGRSGSAMSRATGASLGRGRAARNCSSCRCWKAIRIPRWAAWR